MARKPKSVYERIEETQNEITIKEKELSQLRIQLNNLFDEKDDLEMRQTWAAIKNNGLSMEDIQKLLDKQNKLNSKSA